MHCKSYSHFFSKKFQHICVLLDVNFNESLTNNIVSFEQLGPDLFMTHKTDISSYFFISVIFSGVPVIKCQLIFFIKNRKNDFYIRFTLGKPTLKTRANLYINFVLQAVVLMASMLNG